jgi:hypothetical protein
MAVGSGPKGVCSAYAFAGKPRHLCGNGATAVELMRGHHQRSGSLVSYVSIEERIPAHHPLRQIRQLAYQALDRFGAPSLG